MTKPQRLIVGLSGASGIIYGVRMLQILKDMGVETHLVVTKAAEMTLAYETTLSMKEVSALAFKRYASGDVGAAISSGSFPSAGMVVAPCSIKSMSEIATGVTSTLLTRAADVTLKERRRLVLMIRETPFHTGHLRTMTQLSEMGAVIAPPLPAFYAQPKTVEDLVDQSVRRTLDLFGFDAPDTKRWGEDITPGRLDRRTEEPGTDD